jgi:hypothetical protein
VSFQITVLKVLAGHPAGRASVADLTRHVSILISSGSEWADRIKGLAARAPQLDIFGSAFVLRDDSGWQITDAGQQFLAWLEAPARGADCHEQQPEVHVAVAPAAQTSPQPPLLRLVVDNEHASRPDRAPDPMRRTA